MSRADKRRPKESLYIALEDLDFSWYQHEIEKVKKLWDYGWYIADIARKINREIDEVAILIMDLARNKKIKRRKNGVFGDFVLKK